MNKQYTHSAKVINLAIDELKNLKLGTAFEKAVGIILACPGRVIVSGMGKSGHVGRKIAATLASTGTASFFMHPAEAAHGDLGMITPKDVILVITNSGETREVADMLRGLYQVSERVPIIAMTGNPASYVARVSDVHLNVGVKREACPHNKAPTTSTTIQMVMGDCLAMRLMEEKGFSAEDFQLTHPGGSLGQS